MAPKTSRHVDSVFSIIGSGFGLYGYLPSLVGRCAQRIVLPERYRLRFDERPELARFARDIQWEKNEEAALDCADGVVIAQRPIDQDGWIHRCLARARIRYLVLEKPLAPSPAAAEEIHRGLVRSGRIFRIGYVFRYTGWGQRFLRAVGKGMGSGPVSIRWEFLAHHFRHSLHNWKRLNSTGGSAIRFYGIQMIALLAEAGYRDVVDSRACGPTEDEIEQWIATFQGPGLPACEVMVITRSTVSGFRVMQTSRSGGSPLVVFAELNDPFDLDLDEEGDRLGDLDRRVGLLGQLCRSLWEDSQEPDWYDETIRLWRRVEDKTRFSRGNEWPA